ncbi:unnamed protein product [Trifolium pratense]|uniref:Uncharacterized protein n=1 Tax=Trifolium pratense TaxID=57577 RepID=A0ACB0J583_TRIPR|nr:unnamed protein product [Trifolium pratense]
MQVLTMQVNDEDIAVSNQKEQIEKMVHEMLQQDREDHKLFQKQLYTFYSNPIWFYLNHEEQIIYFPVGSSKTTEPDVNALLILILVNKTNQRY